MKDINDANFIPTMSVAEEIGVSSKTIDRWLRNPAMDFPAPIKVNTRCYWLRGEINKWKANRTRHHYPMKEAG